MFPTKISFLSTALFLCTCHDPNNSNTAVRSPREGIQHVSACVCVCVCVRVTRSIDYMFISAPSDHLVSTQRSLQSSISCFDCSFMVSVVPFACQFFTKVVSRCAKEMLYGLHGYRQAYSFSLLRWVNSPMWLNQEKKRLFDILTHTVRNALFFVHSFLLLFSCCLLQSHTAFCVQRLAVSGSCRVLLSSMVLLTAVTTTLKLILGNSYSRFEEIIAVCVDVIIHDNEINQNFETLAEWIQDFTVNKWSTCHQFLYLFQIIPIFCPRQLD